MVIQKIAGRITANLASALTSNVTGAVPYRPKMSKSDTRIAIEDQLGQRVKLADYRSTVTPLTSAERELLIEQSMEMLEKVFAHMPLKRALHAIDPLQSLRLLRLRHASLDERAFQCALMEIFVSLRDLHTNYLLPSGYRGKFAFLPFRVEEYYETDGGGAATAPKRRYVVSWVSQVNTVSSLKTGMIVTHWNGMPIDLAVGRNGNREAGSNADARRAQGIESLTLRWLGMSLPPDEDWVMLTYTDGTQTYNARFDWEVIDSADKPEMLAGLNNTAGTNLHLGLDLNRVLLGRALKLIFDPQALAVEREAVVRQNSAAAHEPPRAETSTFPDVFPRFGEVNVPDVGKFGYIRLKTFAPKSVSIDGTVAEFGRILATLPSSGLILDVRGNGGGYLNIGERMLQMLSPRQITPEPFHFLATPLTLALATTANNWDEWNQTIAQGLESGATYSQGFPLTDPAACNSIGQLYQGPVVLVTDALCYSTTDLFAAGFQDHEIGLILGCHGSTGAGGATVWDDARLRSMTILPKNPFVALPKGAGMRVAALRSTRVGSRNGTPLEDYGVVPDARYYLTKSDVVGHNEDLIAAAARMLVGLPKQTLALTPLPAAPRQQFTVRCSNIDRLDLFLQGRPVTSQDVTASSFTLGLSVAAAIGNVLYAQGYRQGQLVVSVRLPM